MSLCHEFLVGGAEARGSALDVHDVLLLQPGVYKVPDKLIFFPNPIILNLDLLPQTLRPFSPLDILPSSLNILWKIILVSPSPFLSMLYSSSQP